MILHYKTGTIRRRTNSTLETAPEPDACAASLPPLDFAATSRKTRETAAGVRKLRKPCRRSQNPDPTNTSSPLRSQTTCKSANSVRNAVWCTPLTIRTRSWRRRTARDLCTYALNVGDLGNTVRTIRRAGRQRRRAREAEGWDWRPVSLAAFAATINPSDAHALRCARPSLPPRIVRVRRRQYRPPPTSRTPSKAHDAACGAPPSLRLHVKGPRALLVSYTPDNVIHTATNGKRRAYLPVREESRRERDYRPGGGGPRHHKTFEQHADFPQGTYLPGTHGRSRRTVAQNEPSSEYKVSTQSTRTGKHRANETPDPMRTARRGAHHPPSDERAALRGAAACSRCTGHRPSAPPVSR